MYLCTYHGGEIIDSPTGTFPFERAVELVRDYPHIVAVTVMSADASALKELLAGLDGVRKRGVPVRVAGTRAYFEMLELGVYGFHSIEASIAPRLCSTAVDAHRRGDKVEAKRLLDVVARLCEIVHTPEYCYPRSIKPILNHLGFDVGIIRKPYMPPKSEHQLEMAERVAGLELGRFEELPHRSPSRG